MTVRGLGFFHRWWHRVRSFAGDARGVTAIEYGLIASCVALAFIAIAILLGEDVGSMFESLSDSVQDVTDS